MEPDRPTQTAELPLVEIIRHPETATVVLRPPRPAILATLREPGSASTVASSLGLPRQRLPYHIRELERVGLLKLVENRRRRGCVERVMQATARHYLVSPEILGELGSVHPADILRLGTFGWAPLMAAASRAILDLAVLREGLGDQVPALMLPAQVRFSAPTAFNDFVAELTAELTRLCAKYHDETASTADHRFFVAAYPQVPSPPVASAPLARSGE